MKNEYLNRTATFTATNLDNLITEVGDETVGRPDCDVVDVFVLATASRILAEALAADVCSNNDEAITLRGEDFAAKAGAALRRLKNAAMHSHTHMKEGGDSMGRVFNVLGASVYMLLGVEDKLYDSDHVKEEPND